MIKNKLFLFSKIENACKTEISRKAVEKEKLITEIHKLYKLSAPYMDEVKDLCAIANKAIECGYCLCTSNYTLPKSPVLVTDRTTHTLGFYGKCMLYHSCANFKVRYNKIGYDAGGTDFFTDGKDFYYGTKTNKLPLTEFDYNKLNHWKCGLEYFRMFVKDFPEFRTKVLSFVENIEQYHCFKKLPSKPL